MDVEENSIDKRGPGMEPIPEPDKSRAGREGLSGLDEVVGGIMDNVQETVTGTSGSDARKDQEAIDDEK
ncbi:hypothetical protein PaeBR_16925 [Paenibacillus sp. BR2-3]|uniref:hypothetical protein n=1 Tax=Paenibacillus sp. BR2-3 TaxID=3048494 RepID=UPI00397752F2